MDPSASNKRLYLTLALDLILGFAAYEIYRQWESYQIRETLTNEITTYLDNRYV